MASASRQNSSKHQSSSANIKLAASRKGSYFFNILLDVPHFAGPTRQDSALPRSGNSNLHITTFRMATIIPPLLFVTLAVLGLP
jgi:hypothetical protein